MKVGEFNIYWKYEWKIIDNGKHAWSIPSIDCIIEKDKTAIGVMGTAVCSSKDNFCRDKGRRISLHKALQMGKVMFPETFHRKFRAQIWETYRTLTKEPRWKLKEFKRNRSTSPSGSDTQERSTQATPSPTPTVGSPS